MLNFSRRTKVIAAFLIVIAIGYGIALYWEGRNKVPSDFTAARLQSAIIAQTIVNNSNQSTATLEKINQYDQQGDYTNALALTNGLVAQSQDLRDQAVDLSNQVENMTRALSGVNDFDAQQAALEAISSRLAVINQLVNYSGDLGELLDVLRSRFTGTAGTSVQVQTLVNQINTDVNAINNFNAQAGQAMDKFDSIEKI
jgi:DNA repair ATPase RecN